MLAGDRPQPRSIAHVRVPRLVCRWPVQQHCGNRPMQSFQCPGQFMSAIGCAFLIPLLLACMQGGPFIMYPAVASDDSHPNARTFSSCSLASIADVVSSKGECLLQPHVCASSGSCCLGQHLLPAGSECREQTDDPNDCMQPAICDGESAQCPAETAKADGALCQTATLLHGVCVSGTCQRPFTNLCATLGLDACVLAQTSCMPACINNSLSGGSCRPFSTACGVDAFPATGAVDGIVSTSSCPRADSTPCVQPDQTVGVCGSNVCQTCDAACQEALSMDVEVVECNISVSSSSVCSEPCGGGQQVNSNGRQSLQSIADTARVCIADSELRLPLPAWRHSFGGARVGLWQPRTWWVTACLHGCWCSPHVVLHSRRTVDVWDIQLRGRLTPRCGGQLYSL
jgi:hypothetical protein